jgi:hypothetical protein
MVRIWIRETNNSRFSPIVPKTECATRLPAASIARVFEIHEDQAGKSSQKRERSQERYIDPWQFDRNKTMQSLL